MTEDEHTETIRQVVATLDPRVVDEYMQDDPGLRIEAIMHYLEMGPDLDDCYPLLHHAESLVALAEGDTERATYAERMGRRVRTMLACRVIQDINEVTQSENGDST